MLLLPICRDSPLFVGGRIKETKIKTRKRGCFFKESRLYFRESENRGENIKKNRPQGESDVTDIRERERMRGGKLKNNKKGE